MSRHVTFLAIPSKVGNLSVNTFLTKCGRLGGHEYLRLELLDSAPMTKRDDNEPID